MAADQDGAAERVAEHDRLRALRAERLARLRSGAPAARAEAEAALREFLKALLPDEAPAAETDAPAIPPAAVLPFQRPAAAPCDLDVLPGAGPGLVWALRRAGVTSLAAVAALEPADLARRLGPVGHLVPASAWIEAARSAAAH